MVFTSEEEDNAEIVKNAIWNRSIQKQLNTFELKGFLQQGMIELIDMTYTERLYAARNLAFLMQSNNTNIKIFHVKNNVIFSAFDDILNKVLFKLLESHGIKEMKIIDTPFHLIVDNILEINNKQILLTQNHLLNYKNSDNILFQLSAIEKIRKSGILIKNYNTSELLDNPVKSIKKFIMHEVLNI